MKYLIPFIILALLGVLFLQEGITGAVVAEPTGLSSNLINYVFIFIGAKIILFFSFLFYRTIKHKPDNKYLNKNI